MKTKGIILWIIASVLAALFGCISVAAGAMWGVCFKSVLGGTICMATYIVAILETGHVLLNWDDDKDTETKETP